MEHGTQVRCRDCATGWVNLGSQEEIPSASHRSCAACHQRKNSHRAEQRAQEPKRRGRPPKKKSNRGRKLKENTRDNDATCASYASADSTHAPGLGAGAATQ